MFYIFKKFFLISSLFILISCSSNKDTTPVVESLPKDEVMNQQLQDANQDVVLEDEIIYDDEELVEEIEEPVSKEEKYYSYQPKYDGTLLFRELEKNVKKVEVKKIVVKPVVDVDMDPVSLSMDEVKDLVDNVSLNIELEDGVKYDEKQLMALIENYKNILQLSYSCCVSNIVQNFKDKNISKKTLLGFLNLDAEEYGLQNMCVIVDNKDIKDVFEDDLMSLVVIEAKQDCICNNADYLRKNIDNFYKIYDLAPDFYNDVFVFRFKDKKGRIVEQDMNESVLNIAEALDKCIN